MFSGLHTDDRVADADFERLIEQFYMPLYRFALSLSRNEADACDLVQQTFYLWATKGHQLRDGTKVKTWLFTTLRREFLGSKRHEDRFSNLEDEVQLSEPSDLGPAIGKELDADTVQKALHELAERYRGPLSLFYMQQHSYREIAEILDIPVGTVMSRISRGKAELRKAIQDSISARKILPVKEGGAL